MDPCLPCHVDLLLHGDPLNPFQLFRSCGSIIEEKPEFHFKVWHVMVPYLSGMTIFLPASLVRSLASNSVFASAMCQDDVASL